mmetsp:Transcript_45005/g.105222  ORF Transcript_45005/g.105222 Transcript_45005/m.105222 type:complete len:263 (-) Transcript_45005:970-1758(-)
MCFNAEAVIEPTLCRGCRHAVLDQGVGRRGRGSVGTGTFCIILDAAPAVQLQSTCSSTPLGWKWHGFHWILTREVDVEVDGRIQVPLHHGFVVILGPGCRPVLLLLVGVGNVANHHRSRGGGIVQLIDFFGLSRIKLLAAHLHQCLRKLPGNAARDRLGSQGICAPSHPPNDLSCSHLQLQGGIALSRKSHWDVLEKSLQYTGVGGNIDAPPGAVRLHKIPEGGARRNEIVCNDGQCHARGHSIHLQEPLREEDRAEAVEGA